MRSTSNTSDFGRMLREAWPMTRQARRNEARISNSNLDVAYRNVNVAKWLRIVRESNG